MISKGLFFAITTTVLWGTLPIVLKYALTFASVTDIVFSRFAIAFGVLVLVLRKGLRRPPLLGVLAGLCLATNYYGFFKGLELVNASGTQVLMQIGPVVLAFIGVFFFKEPMNPQKGLGFVLALLGFGLFYRDQVILLQGWNAGFWWILISIAGWVAWAALQKVLVRDYPPQFLNLVVYGVASLSFLPAADLPSFLGLGPWQGIIILYLGLNTLIAYGALNEALRLLPSNEVALVISLNPLITLTLINGYFKGLPWMAQEEVSWVGWVGALVLLLGVVLVVGPNGSKA